MKKITALVLLSFLCGRIVAQIKLTTSPYRHHGEVTGVARIGSGAGGADEDYTQTAILIATIQNIVQEAWTESATGGWGTVRASDAYQALWKQFLAVRENGRTNEQTNFGTWKGVR